MVGGADGAARLGVQLLAREASVRWVGEVVMGRAWKAGGGRHGQAPYCRRAALGSRFGDHFKIACSPWESLGPPRGHVRLAFVVGVEGATRPTNGPQTTDDTISQAPLPSHPSPSRVPSDCGARGVGQGKVSSEPVYGISLMLASQYCGWGRGSGELGQCNGQTCVRCGRGASLRSRGSQYVGPGTGGQCGGPHRVRKDIGIVECTGRVFKGLCGKMGGSAGR